MNDKFPTYYYEDLKLLQRMRSKMIIFLYLVYIVFIEYVFINKVDFDIILISTVLTFLFAFSLSSMLKSTKQEAVFFKELKEVYKTYAKKYKNEHVKDIHNTYENQLTLFQKSFVAFFTFLAALGGTYFSIVLAHDYMTFNVFVPVFALIFINVTFYGFFAEIVKEINEKEYRGDSSFGEKIFLNLLIRPTFKLIELINQGLAIIIALVIVFAIVKLIMGVATFNTEILLELLVDTGVVLLNAVVVSVGAAIAAGITYMGFGVLGFSIEIFSKKDILFLEKGLYSEIRKLKDKHNIDSEYINAQSEVRTKIKSIMVYAVPFVIIFLVGMFVLDGFNIISFVQPIGTENVDIFSAMPSWDMVKNADGFFASIFALIGFAILAVIGIIAIPFLAIAWVIVFIFKMIMVVVNAITGVILVLSFVSPVLFAAYTRLQNDKSLSNFTSIYFYMAFIMIIFFMSLM
ncbi:MAG: hypothetical protein JXQ66_04720 [Campylobacterales bacterium]|nr:hypothetical protein [Campylobacterales bacterium]